MSTSPDSMSQSITDLQVEHFTAVASMSEGQRAAYNRLLRAGENAGRREGTTSIESSLLSVFAEDVRAK